MDIHTQQLPLHYPDDADFSAPFVEGAANLAARRLLIAWPRWSDPMQILYGETGCGKSHLAHQWADKTQYPLTSTDSLTENDIAVFLASGGMVVEDIHASTATTENFLLHLCNLAKSERHFLLLTSSQPVAVIPWQQAALSSRLISAPQVMIGAPDDAMLLGLLRGQFARRQMRVADDVLHYIAPRIERSYAAIAAVVAQLDAMALASHKPVTVSLARVILAA